LNKRKDGKSFKIQYSIIPVQAKEEIKNFVAIGIDTSREEELEEEVFRLKFHDSLTGIYNRYGIKFEMHKLIQKLKKDYIGVASILDVTSFSQINTIFSHDIGDQILMEISNLLKNNFPESSIGRIGGDKFLVFRIIKQDELFDFINKFIPLFKSKRFSDMHLSLGINIGISVFPNDAKDMEELLINANSALKIAKSRGRNNVKIFDIKISKNMEEINKKMDLIVEAYENDWFEIFLQPYFDVKNINLAGFESLLRIRHPEKGIIPPGFFINTLEKSELLFEIEKRTIQKVARIMEEWKKKSYIVKPVSINITAKSFAQSNTIEALKKYANGNMNIEIIERILVDNKDYTQKVLKELKKFNIKCFLDDFGTGYSSLSYITTMPIDTIKIDISFIRKFLEDKKTYAIVESIISLSKKLGMKTVAEGVENESQFKELKKLNCDTVQGYLFAKPVPYRQAEKWLKTE
jgi:diguanylate cyclase (GGDEF)-like protein